MAKLVSLNALALAGIAALTGRFATLTFQTDDGRTLRVNGRFGKGGFDEIRRAGDRAGIALDAIPFQAFMVNGKRIDGRDSFGRFLPRAESPIVWVSFRSGKVSYVAQDGQRITLA